MFTAEDFICLDMSLSPRCAEMFTLQAGIVHCEAKLPGEELLGVFFVATSRELMVEWVDLKNTRLEIK